MATQDESQLLRQTSNDNNNYQLTEDGKNAQIIVCPYCACKILLKKTAELLTIEVFLPFVTARKDSNKQDPDQIDGEKLNQFWKVNDMFIFENVGFTKTVGSSIKYLICADCEIGPIGWHDINDKTTYLIAAQRVHYSD